MHERERENATESKQEKKKPGAGDGKENVLDF